MSQKYFGKYRGVVLNNVDPLGIGRMQVQVPDIGLLPMSWAMPCFPFGGIQNGMYALPSIGAGVWVEFEQGNLDFPIWCGAWFGSRADVPALVQAAPPVTPPVVIQTLGQTTLMLSDVPGPTGGILLKTLTGALISINDVGITISNGKGAIIAMTGPAINITGTPVNVNAGALTVT